MSGHAERDLLRSQISAGFAGLALRLRALRERLEANDAEPPTVEDLIGALADIRDTEKQLLARAAEFEETTEAERSRLEKRVADRTREGVEASARLHSVIEELPVGVVIIDADGNLKLTSRRAEQLLGLSADEIGRSLRGGLWTWRDLRGRVIPGPERAPARVFATGAATYDERFELELQNGRRFIMEASAVPVEVEDGVIAVALTFQDVTVQEQRERAERDFVTNAAHELQTPIAAITSAVEVLQAGAKENEADRDRFLAHIEAACARLARLTRALLVLARAQAGHERPRAEVIEIEPLLRSVAAALPLDAEVKVDCPPDLAVVANRALLEQSLVNLGANAVKYTSGRVLLAAERDEGRVLLEVRDDGGGIDVEERQRVFDRFYRASDAGDGFGLGLAIVAEAVKAINGELHLDSTDGGTGVSISLPAAGILHK